MYVGGGHAVLDGKVREDLSQRATFQQVQGTWFPPCRRLEAVHYARMGMSFEGRQIDKECPLKTREGYRSYKLAGPSMPVTQREGHMPSHLMSLIMTSP